MKILILAIYSETNYYNKMLQIQRYQKLNPNITRYFVTFRNQNSEIEIKDDMIFINGNESRLNITKKTLLSMKYLLNNLGQKYDFIIRSNISTIIDTNNLYNWLYEIPNYNIYCTGNILKLQWLDHTSGIFNKELFGTYYASGTSIILSYDVAKNIIENMDKIRHDIIDDLSIGVYLNNYNPTCIDNLKKYLASFIFVDNKTNVNDIKNVIFFRNRTNNGYDRTNDLLNMVRIIGMLNK